MVYTVTYRRYLRYVTVRSPIENENRNRINRRYYRQDLFSILSSIANALLPSGSVDQLETYLIYD